MKKVFFKTMVVAALAGSAMSSCVNEIEDLYDPSYAAKKKQQYEAQWKIQFGSIDPEHNWGFSDDASEAKAMTRGANVEANQWADFITVPTALSAQEVEDVLAVFNNPIDQSASKQVNWSDFWVQHVYQGSNSYVTEPDMNGATQELKDVLLDQLQAAYYNENGELVYEHVNNFNASDGSTMLMQRSGTVSFAYMNPKDAGNLYSDYVIMEVNGQYYVGFDYSCNEPNTTVKADGIYNDWIVKIIPAEYINTKRIICEDLGNIGDFDFNDIVFDAYITSAWNGSANVQEAVISVKAAGGTLPIYIGGVEIHEAMGVASNVMVNTGAPNGASAPAAIFRIPVSSGNIADIEVKVNDAVVLEAPQGDAPQKICVPTTFKWCTERTNIKDAYPNFVNWSQDQNQSTDWYNNPEEGSVM
ncbi:MAG: DUF4842 domain-containing protein [Bacteroidaceae bacterium]|nr:DUF4842 domain-containing protein [Bacteroidaceae bacterium]